MNKRGLELNHILEWLLVIVLIALVIGGIYFNIFDRLFDNILCAFNPGRCAG
jgi:hypothetical protein